MPSGKQAVRKVDRKIKHADPQEILKRIDGYFDWCDKEKKTYTVSGLALYMGYSSRDAIADLQNEEKHKDYYTPQEKQAIKEAIKRARLRIESQQEELLLTAKNVAGVIFNLKNNFGWKDREDEGSNNLIILNVRGLED